MGAIGLLPAASTDVVRRKRFTREEVDRMLKTDLFAGERFELIDGDLIDKMGQNPPHAYVITVLAAWLVKLFGTERVRVQLPVEAGSKDRKWSLPEPDIAVLARSAEGAYRARHPRGDEMLLVVEVSDTSLRHDSTTKRELYARAGVPEYWVADLGGRRLFVHRKLRRGRYSVTQFLGESDYASVESLPERRIRVAALLP